MFGLRLGSLLMETNPTDVRDVRKGGGGGRREGGREKERETERNYRLLLRCF